MIYSQLVENVFTDADGKFVTTESISENPYILINKQGYFPFTYSQFSNRDKYKNIFLLDIPSYIQTHIKNTNPVASDDYIQLEGFPETIVPPDGILQLHGKNVDTTVCCILAAGYKPFTIPVFIKKFPQTADSAMPVTCTPIGNQTIVVNILY